MSDAMPYELVDQGSYKSVDKGRRLLDQIYQKFPHDPKGVSSTMAKLLQGLHEIRREMSKDRWQFFCKEVVPKHELATLIHQDPFTLHSAQKPRGYAGDAQLLDYIYGHRPPQTTAIGKHIFAFTTNTPASRAVRTRADRIAGIIDRIARQRPYMRILSIACGHLREAEISEAVQEGKVAEYVAFDQDKDSLAHVLERFNNKNVVTLHGSIGDLLLGKHKNLGGFDFVYAAGLYDYLSQAVATRLTTWMFNATRSGGVTLLTNFLPDIVGAGYMEAFMAWDLIFRNREELIDTARKIPSDQIAEKRVYVEEDERVVFVELSKAKQPQPLVDTPYQSNPMQQNVPVGTKRVNGNGRTISHR